MRLFLLNLMLLSTLLICACAYHAKQPVDDAYYKRTQGIEWPEAQ